MQNCAKCPFPKSKLLFFRIYSFSVNQKDLGDQPGLVKSNNLGDQTQQGDQDDSADQTYQKSQSYCGEWKTDY